MHCANNTYIKYDVVPNTKPRQTRRDKWLKPPRKCVAKYRAYSDAVNALDIQLPFGCHHIVFCIPMPKSWSKKKKNESRYQKHQQTPDRDNLDKALLDSIYKHSEGGDQHIWDGRITKIWVDEGAVLVGVIEPPPMDLIIDCIEQGTLPLMKAAG